MHTKLDLKGLLLNTALIYLSYLLAVVIRYKILRSEPGIDALSVPYLLVALMYSLLLSCTFEKDEFPRWLTHSAGMDNTFKTLSQNAIGCLVLLAVFYVVGIVNFSRWALFLFWLLSSLALVIKREVIYSRISRKRCRGEDIKRILLVGDGKRAKEYIASIKENPQFGIQIAGYIGDSDELKTNVDVLFEADNYPEPIIKWLGKLNVDSLPDILEKNNIDRIVIAEDNMDDERDLEIFKAAQKKGIRTLITVNSSSLINPSSGIHDIGIAKEIELNEDVHNRVYYPSGIVITIALLLLMLITQKFEMKAIDTLKGFENYKCVIIALFGFFLYLSGGNMVMETRKALKRTVLCWLACLVLIIVYELIYNVNVVQSMRLDVFVTTIVLILCMLISIVSDAINRAEYMFME